jgi:hypothetical protein
MFSKIAGVTAAIAVGASVTVAGAQNAAVQWRVEDGGNGHWYQIRELPSRPTCVDAETMAAQLGARLIGLETQQECDFFRQLRCMQGKQSLSAWQDLRRIDGQWQWGSGAPFAFSSWSPGQPDFGDGATIDWAGPSGQCDSLTWGDEICNVANLPSSLFIEFSADCNNDGIVDYGQCLDGTFADYNSNNIPDCCDRGGACVAGSYAVQWRNEDGGNGHWYRMSSIEVDWNTAMANAAALGGHGATPRSATENEFAFRLARPRMPTHGAWLGAGAPTNSCTDPSAYRWVTGEPWDFDEWYPGEPNGGFGSNDCGMAYSSWTTGWNDMPKSWGGGVVIEWSADCNNDGTVDYGQILTGQLTDANGNGVPDTCEFSDCNHDGIADAEQVKRGQLPDYDGNNIPDCCDRGEACVVGSYPVQWRTAEGGNGHWYQATPWTAPKTWPDALASAREIGGLLACVTSAGENDWIAAHSDLSQPGCAGGSDGWHLGGYQDFTAADYSEPSGGWRWISGEPWSYTAWLTGVPGGDRPNNYGPGGEQYLKMSELPYAPRWDDVGTGNGNTKCGAILEWSADCNNDGTVDYGQILRGELPDINHNGTPDTCECIGDIYVDRAINGADLGALLAYWGPVTSSAASRACDLNGDGVVNGSDLGILLAYWGTCGN